MREVTPVRTTQDTEVLFSRPNLELEETSPQEALQKSTVVPSEKTLIHHGVGRPQRRVMIIS